MEISGRTALLTGATGGLGRVIAQALASRGARVALSARKPEVLERLASELPGDDHRILPSDLAEPGAAEKLAGDAGDVDILIANAGLPGAGPITDFTAEEVGRALRVNLEAPMLLAQALSPAMIERRSGHLVFMSSLAGKAASPHSSIYNATKFGLRGFSLALRCDLAPMGVGVSVVSPGFIRDAGMFADAGAKLPFGLGTGTPDQVGDAVVKAIEKDRTELVVAPLAWRVLAHAGLASPGVAVRMQSGTAGQRTGKRIAAAHPREKR